MGEGNQVRPRGRRGSRTTIPEQGGDLGDLTMGEIKKRAALEQKERETQPEESSVKIRTEKEIKELEALVSVLDAVDFQEEINNAPNKGIAYYQDRLVRQKKLLEHVESLKGATEEEKERHVNNIKLTEKIIAYLEKNTPKSENAPVIENVAIVKVQNKQVAIEKWKKDVAPTTSTEDKKTETLRELREIITNAKLELKHVEREIAEIRAENLPEIKSFPKSFIEDKITKMLQAFDKITKVISVEAPGIGNKISLALKILAEEDEIGINADIENIGGMFMAKNLEIGAGMLTKIYLKSKIKPKLDQIEELLRGEVEKETGKKVEKIWVENGELRVEYEKNATDEIIIKRKGELLQKQAEIKKVLADSTKAEKRLTESEHGTPVPEPAIPTTSTTETTPVPKTKSAPPKKETAPKKTEKGVENEEVTGFISEFDLGPILPAEFEGLDEAQKLKVIRDLKRRIVDIVKSDAQTQYSEDLKERTKIAQIRASINKELEMKNFEARAFVAIRDTEEGKKLIVENLTQLTEITKKREISINNGKPEIVFINPDDKADATEKVAIAAFNTAANNFREMPYEWGQEVKRGSKWNPEIVKGHRTKYEQVKKEFEKARNAILTIEGRKKGEEAALTDMLQLDNIVQLDQLINTHPEFEAELSRLSKSGGLGKQGKDVWNMAGGKGATNKLIFAGGFTARLLVKGTAIFSNTSIVTWLAASGIGAVVGGIRGHVKGKETLTERQQRARHGQEDTSKERVVTADVTHLNKRLEDLLSQIDNSKTDEEKAKKLSMLEARIEHTRGKIEKGQVNFGDVKSTLANQFNLVSNLNKALVLKETMSGKNNTELKERIDRLLAAQDENISEKTSQAQSAFVKKQMWKGAAIGAGAATAGYVVRWFGEQVGGWWSHHVSEVTNTNSDTTLKTLHSANVKLHEAGLRESQLKTALDTATKPSTTGPAPEILVPASTINNFHGDSITLDHGKGGIQGILDLKNQMRTHYNNDFSKAPESVQKFMADHDVTRQAIKLGLYDPSQQDESALIGEGSVLKFDEHGNLLFGKPDASGNIPVLEKYHGTMIHSGHHEPVALSAETIQTPGTDALKSPDSFHLENKYPEGYGLHLANTPPPHTEISAEEAIRAKLHEQYNPKASWRTDATRPLKELHGTHRELRSPVDWDQKNTGTYQHDLLNRHPEFAKNPFHLSGTNLIRAFDASQRNIKFLFEEKPIYLMNVGAKELIHSDIANSDPEPALMARCLRQLEFFSRLKPKGLGLLGIGKAETAEEYMARAFQKLVKNGGLRLFEESIKDIRK